MRDLKGRFLKGYHSNISTEFKKGQKGTRTGVFVTKETRLKMRMAKLGKAGPWKNKRRIELSGNKNNKWKGVS